MHPSTDLDGIRFSIQSNQYRFSYAQVWGRCSQFHTANYKRAHIILILIFIYLFIFIYLYLLSIPTMWQFPELFLMFLPMTSHK